MPNNPLFNALGGGNMPMNPQMQMVQAFMQFKQDFTGDPKAEVQKLLQSGKISQQELNRLQMQAQQISSLLGGANP